MASPAYSLVTFIAACGNVANIFVQGGAMKTAASDFGLNTMAEIAGFIHNEGLENPQHANTTDWERNPDPKNNPILVDSYNFFSYLTYGYIGFFFNPMTSLWIIKSFKLNEKDDPRPLHQIAQLAREKKK